MLLAQQAWAWPDLRIAKSGPAQAAPGDVITYTLSYSNVGGLKSTSVVMKDFLPANVTALTNTLNGGTLSGSTISWSLGTLNSNAKGSRAFQVRINTNTPSGSSITNRAQIFGYEAEETGKTNDNYAKLITSIVGVNRAPVAQPDAYTVAEDGTLTITSPGVLGNDSDPDGNTLTAILVGGPAHGTLTLNPNGGFTYIPSPNYNGPDSFTYKANDGTTNSGVVTVTLNVTAVNDAPVTQPDTYAVAEDGTLTIAGPGVLGNDSDVDGDTLTAALVTGPAHGTLTLNPNGGFIYIPSPNYFGPDSFTYRANDGTTNSGIVTVTLNVTAVNDAPVAQPDSYTVAEDGVLTVAGPGVLGNDSDVDGNALTAVLVTGPAHGVLTLNPNGGFIYTPNPNYNGPDSFTYRANDGTTNSGIVTVTLNVTVVNDAPVAQPDTYTVAEDGILTIAGPGVLGNDSDVDGNTLTAILVNGPTHGTLTLNPNGSFIYIPNTNYSGPDSFTYRANDGTTNSGIVTVTLTVTAVNDVPVAQPDAYTVAEDGVLTVAGPGVLVNDSDLDGDVLTAALVTGPAHGLLTLNPNGGFIYTPNLNYFGPDTFTYRANDGTTNSSVATVTLTVTAANDAPVAQPDAYTVAEDGTLTIAGPGVLSNDSDADGDILTAILVNGPTHGTLILNPNGSFSYIPNPNYNGPDSFTYRAYDGTTNSSIVTVTLNVTAANDAPIAQPDSYTVAEDGALTIVGPGVLGNDSDPDGDLLTAILVNGPSHGTLTLNPDGSFSYTPNPNYNGPDSFTYRANDGTTNSSIVTVIFNVTAVNDAPIAQPDSYTVAEDGTLTIAGPGVLGNDSDSDGDLLTAILVNGPSHGTLTLNPNGSFSYTPSPNYNGPDSFTYRANDGTTNSGIVTVVFNVTPVNDVPAVQNDQYSTPKNIPLNILAPGVLANDSDVDGDVLTSILVGGPTHGTLILNLNGSFSYTPDSNYNGLDAFTYRADDGTTNSGVATVTLNVTSVTTNNAPVAQPDSYSVTEDGNLTIAGPGVLGNDSDPDSDTLTAILVNGPTHGTLTLNPDGSFSYTPNPNYNGPDSFTYRANDGTTNSGIVTVTLTVNAVNDAPVAQPDAYTVAEDGALIIPGPGVLGNDSDPDNDTLTAILVNGPTHGTLTLSPDGSFSYTPNPDYNGPDSFTYRANDGTTNSSIVAVTLNVTAVNDTPVVQDDSYTTTKNVPLIVSAPGVLSNDSDVDGNTLSAIVVTLPTHGQLALSTNGNFSYIPTTNFTGTDLFTYLASDGVTNSGIATVTITVTQTNSPPDTNNWTGSQFTGFEDTILSIGAPGVLAGMVDADGDVLVVIPVSATSHGALTLNTNGSFSYLADTNYFGPDSFQFRVSDGKSSSAVLMAMINMLPVNDPPSFVKGGNVRIQPNSGAQAVVGWATQISPGPTNELGQTVIFEVTNSNPALFSTAPVISANGTLAYTPAANVNGSATITVIARDSGGTANGGVNASAPQAFAIVINAPPTVQIASPTNGASFFVPGDFTVLANANDSDGTVVKVEFYVSTNKIGEVTNAPFFVVLTNLPTGNYTFTAVATDDFGATNSATPVTVSVIQRPPLTLLSSVYYNPQTDYFEQRVRITNPSYSTLNAVRVMIYNLTNVPAITVGNASGYTNGVPYVETLAPVPPGSYVDMVIEFISPLRVKPNPVLAAELVPAPLNLTPLQGMFKPINRAFLLANRTFFLEFGTQSNRVYTIQYSDDLIRWKDAQPAIPGNGTWVQWIDNGLPKTERPPVEAPTRFYRLIQLP